MVCIFLSVKNKGELSETKKIKYLLTGRVSLGAVCATVQGRLCCFVWGFLLHFISIPILLFYP